VLLVDDHPADLYALERHLRPLGLPVVTARSGEEALERAASLEVAVALVDVRMPGIDGMETARRLRTGEGRRAGPAAPPPPIILLSELARDPEALQRGYSAGAVDFLAKPVEPQVLRNKVAALAALAAPALHPALPSSLPPSLLTAPAEERLALLMRVGALLSAALPEDALPERLAALLVPALADVAWVDLLVDGTFRRLGLAAHAGVAAELAARARDYSLAPEAAPLHPPTAAFLARRAVLVPDLDEALLPGLTHDAAHAEVWRGLRLRALLSVPLMARDRALGALTLARHAPHAFGREDVELAEEVARRTALALENVRLEHSARGAVRLRDEFLSVASHELKTPLTPLQIKLQALRRSLSAPGGPGRVGTDHVVRELTQAEAQLKRIHTLVDDLLDVSRLARGRLALRLEDVDLSALARNIVSELAPLAQRAGCRVEVEAPSAVVGRWDWMRLGQVASNLLSNALKYGAGLPVHVSVGQRGGRALLQVRDGGIGIAAGDLPRIWGRFERAVSDRHYGGLGLGLYITRQLVESHGGHIGVESAGEGQGATFTVELPLAGPPESGAA
jgi:signal transduction histidine kinase